MINLRLPVLRQVNRGDSLDAHMLFRSWHMGSVSLTVCIDCFPRCVCVCVCVCTYTLCPVSRPCRVHQANYRIAPSWYFVVWDARYHNDCKVNQLAVGLAVRLSGPVGRRPALHASILVLRAILTRAAGQLAIANTLWHTLHMWRARARARVAHPSLYAKKIKHKVRPMCRPDILACSMTSSLSSVPTDRLVLPIHSTWAAMNDRTTCHKSTQSVALGPCATSSSSNNCCGLAWLVTL